MEMVDSSSGMSSMINDCLGKIIDFNDVFSLNNIILFVSLVITVIVVGIKMKMISISGIEKIPFLNKLVGVEKKQVEFVDEQSENGEEDNTEQEEQ